MKRMFGWVARTGGGEANGRGVPLVGQEVCGGGIPWALVLGVPPPPFAFVVTTGVIPFFVEGVTLPVPGVCPANRLCPNGVVTSVNARPASSASSTARIARGRRRARFAGGCAGAPCTSPGCEIGWGVSCGYRPGGVTAAGTLSFADWHGTPGWEIGRGIACGSTWGSLLTVLMFASSTVL